MISRVPLGNIFQGKFSVSKNNAQNIIKIMGNPPCQGTDGFHFLRLPKSLFHDFDLGDIADSNPYLPWIVFLLFYDQAFQTGMKSIAVFFNKSEFTGLGHFCFQKMLPVPIEDILVIPENKVW